MHPDPMKSGEQIFLSFPPMPATGCPHDNACAENFFSLLKNECIYRERPKMLQMAAELVDEYIRLYRKAPFEHENAPTEMRLGSAAQLVS